MRQPTAWPGPRRLLRLLRDIMKGSGSAQFRLDEVVRLIAQELVAEVCSMYVMRPGEVLELFATQGLRPEAVHRTRLRVGEGLVGTIALRARPIALADAQGDPNFAYRPETGEEPFHSLLGVPILRDGRVLGVLVVQNVTSRNYTEDEVEALETVAMVLAELVAAGELIGSDELRLSDGATLLPARLFGVSLNDGLAMGTAVLHHRGIVISRIVAEDPAGEGDRLREALSALKRDLDGLLTRAELAPIGEHRDVLETFRMFADDHGWRVRIEEAIASGLTAEAAVEKVQNDTRARMAQAPNAYLRERLSDLEELNYRLLQCLLDLEGAAAASLPHDAILFARALGPAELLDYDRSHLRGLVLAEGTANSHAAIVARAIDIPVVSRCPEALASIRPGDFVIVDGDTGQVLIRPGDSLRRTFAESIAERSRRKATLVASKDLPSISRDGVAVSLNLNAGLLIDLAQLERTGADGIGLYRTEVAFMARSSFPDLEAQVQLYRRVLDQAKDKPVVFRTLDIGGDKVLPYWSSGESENPALGWRAIRIGLDMPSMLRQQLRALIVAAVDKTLFVQFPMISDVSEFDAARAILEYELDRTKASGKPLPAAVRVGAMLEVPALVLQLPALLARADFISVGSNDLLQFLFASDRANPRLARRYDPLSPPVLNLFRSLTQQAGAAGVPVTICGEMAGRPLEVMALIGCGFRSLSMPGPSLASVRALVRSLNVGGLTSYVDDLACSSGHSVRERLRNYAIDHQVPI